MVVAFNQEKALIGAFSVIVQFRRLIVRSTRIYTDRLQLWPELGQLWVQVSALRGGVAMAGQTGSIISYTCNIQP